MNTEPEPSLKEASPRKEGCFHEKLSRERKREMINIAQARRGMLRNGHPELTAQEVIHKAIEKCQDNLTLGWSGGKCSTIALHIALQQKPNIKVIYNNTGVEFPENVKYVRQVANLWKVNLFELHPKTTFWKIIKEHGFPTIQSRSFKQKRGKWNSNPNKKPMCCWLLKEQTRFQFYKDHNIQGDIGGLRAAESRVRAIHVGQLGQIHELKHPRGFTNYLPIALWTLKECEDYIVENDIPFNETYRTQTRNGCWPCTAYLAWQDNLQRYNPRMYRIVKKMRGEPLLEEWQ